MCICGEGAPVLTEKLYRPVRPSITIFFSVTANLPSDSSQSDYWYIKDIQSISLVEVLPSQYYCSLTSHTVWRHLYFLDNFL